MIVIHYCDQFMIFRGRGLGMRLVGKRNTGRHKTQNAATQLHELRYRCHAFLGLKRTSSVLGTARLQHGFGSISLTLAGEKVPNQAGSVPARFIKASWASMAWLGSARHVIGTLWSYLHCHC